ncbi:HAMP domain-containing histidine kinase [Sphingomonas sp. BT-65]|uniref:HAMP domain-containing sensor histidine kinase n=1 Tax=Sphingomonas sp. BT-65 TaxID=2989821 RepID=UPI002235AE8E|nr:HAMP domain-containing sensor histidine kinase [Sphingomonas sp. BT-65]MCW4460674.1 HAMP domain-containing histidine kinase [Sphingomonas sp. BT-65]
MRWPELRFDRVQTQISLLAVVSILLGILLTVTVVLLFDVRVPDRDSSREIERMDTVAQLAEAAEDPAEVAHIVEAAQRANVRVRLGDRAARSSEDGVKLVRGSSGSRWSAQLSNGMVLVFEPKAAHIWGFVGALAALMLPMVLLLVLVLSIYAVRRIIAPLSTLATAAQSFGRSPHDDRLIVRKGPIEIVQLADGLSEMRSRIRALIDDRTRMLAAVSHDLRTPLTRLRLRVERVADQPMREGMLRELERVDRMLRETLDFLRDDAGGEEPSRADLPSILQTICADFADIGHDVRYEGPKRLTWTCRPGTLARAISNIVDNGLRHGSKVRLRLRVGEDAAAEIDVTDDGAGIPESLHDQVFAPFFKVDDARSDGPGGFGLGLSIARATVRSHGGDIFLRQETPRGFTVRIVIPGTNP